MRYHKAEKYAKHNSIKIRGLTEQRFFCRVRCVFWMPVYGHIYLTGGPFCAVDNYRERKMGRSCRS